MRDTHAGMPEFFEAFQEQEEYFGILGLSIDGNTRVFQFGVTRKGYLTLKRILQTRPFNQMPGLIHQYFLVGSSHSLDELEEHFIHVRVEQGRDAKNIKFQAPEELTANLQWFKEIKDFDEARHLLEIPTA